LNAVDLGLIVFLVAALPIFQLQASLRGLRGVPSALSKRLVRTLLMLGIPTLFLAGDWLITGRPATALGLGPPTTLGGMIGLALAALFIVALPIASMVTDKRGDPAKAAMGRSRMQGAGLLLRTRNEMALFMVMATIIGVAGETLFRGFLLWAFTPLIGVFGAVIVAALAYGLGHGFKTWRVALGSLASAFIFTIAYALTLSLWWLILIHVFAGVYGAWSGHRMANRA
jgi:membrane protease YdiL (CAAX protease family)